MNHLLRSLDVSKKSWQKVDGLLLEVIKDALLLINSDLEPDARICGLPIRLGGLGIQLPSTVSQACRSAAREYLQDLLSSIFPHLPNFVDRDKRRQKERVLEVHQKCLEDLLNSLDKETRVRFADQSSKLGGKWLHVLPISKRKTLADLEFTGGLADRLLLTEIKDAHTAEQIFRHEDIKRAFKTLFEECDATVALEPHAVGKKNGRPFNNRSDRADLLVDGEACHGKKALDITVQLISGAVAGKATNKTNIASGKLLKEAYALVNKKLDSRFAKKVKESLGVVYGGSFCPIVFSTGGMIHEGCQKILNGLRDYSPRHGDELDIAISIILMKFRSRVGRKGLKN